MKQLVIENIIWGVGAVVVLLAVALALVALLFVIKKLANEVGKGLLKVVRFQTAKYWVSRMEREGLTIMQKEYRRMVAERKPSTPDEFRALEDEVPLSAELDEKQTYRGD